MPVTELSQHPIVNLGPLTSVFTAPASCTTRPPVLYLAIKDGYPDRASPFFPKECDPYEPLGDCFPSGAALDDAYESASSLGFPGAGTINYFSPASACPDSYTTAGVAAKNDRGEITSSAGVFEPPVVDIPAGSGSEGSPLEGIIGGNPIFNVLAEALEDGETAVICCPEDYTVGVAGGCFSEVPASVYGETTACRVAANSEDNWIWANATITYNDTVVTGSIISYTATSNVLSTTTATVPPLSADENIFQPVASRPAVTLIFNAAEATATGDDASGSGSGTAAPTETGTSSASGWRLGTSGGGVGVLATAWAVAAVAGVALAAPF
ncbi:LPXTG-domain-containing protein [Colletotrichum higginsianum IMI 349063]|uniref:LPXTG-domain-containing protein n=2 Tax=Colletotrichum higginsianum TaxID=80884 RepID=A0A1B7XUA7_COLHI|nr:LPXTG-domain-containing protein [Colletotrichum higginsianum IMI 349063]OBR03347.1 LPXTG-domain-containing protein [Colletotrichum higginsianum IMI 349063]TIC89907.1 hypothetical protein CH35J_012434 [Colletotrichum higginsianum]